MTPLPEKLNALASRLDRAHLKMAEPLAPYTTFRIGGPADLFYTTDSADDLARAITRSEEHTSELQSPCNLVCRLLLEKKKQHTRDTHSRHEKSHIVDTCLDDAPRVNT